MLDLRDLLRMVRPTSAQRLMRLLHAMVLHSSVLATDVPVTLLDGRQRIVHVEAEPEFNEHGNLIGYTGIVQDVTDRRMAEDRIRHLANFDALTGLPNRRQLIWRAERALEHARRLGHQVALLLIDLDRFKVINDTLGHGAGDELLMEVARRLRVVRAPFRPGDRRARSRPWVRARTARSRRSGRLGGDEFVALLPEVADERDAERVAARILDLMREPIFVGGQECFVTASVGIALFPRDGTHGRRPAAQLRRRDVLGQVGRAATPRTLYRPALAGAGPREARARERAAQGDRAQRAGAALPAQGRRARGASMVGAEALMRWRRDGVLVPPGDFIPLAEETGLIMPLSEMGDPRGGAPGPRLAGQLRLRRLDRGQPAEPAVRAHRPGRAHPPARSRTYGVPHHAIELEITETGLMKDLQNVIPSLHRLNEIGVEISIDDFGTGYSSLAYLTTLPISELKIDRSFVRDLGMTPQSSAVVTAIIALARSLGLRVIAEGVENLRQMEVLHRLGCGVMQGFLFSRPQPPEDIETWLRADRAADGCAVDRRGRRQRASDHVAPSDPGTHPHAVGTKDRDGCERQCPGSLWPSTQRRCWRDVTTARRRSGRADARNYTRPTP